LSLFKALPAHATCAAVRKVHAEWVLRFTVGAREPRSKPQLLDSHQPTHLVVAVKLKAFRVWAFNIFFPLGGLLMIIQVSHTCLGAYAVVMGPCIPWWCWATLC
jgi:hypothetical protein